MFKQTTIFLASSILTFGLAQTAAGQETALTIYSSADPGSFDPLSYVAMQRNQGQAMFPGEDVESWAAVPAAAGA